MSGTATRLGHTAKPVNRHVIWKLNIATAYGGICGIHAGHHRDPADKPRTDARMVRTRGVIVCALADIACKLGRHVRTRKIVVRRLERNVRRPEMLLFSP